MRPTLTELAKNEVGRLLVMEDTEAFRGLLTRTDIMTALSIIKSSPEYQNGGEERERAVFRPQS